MNRLNRMLVLAFSLVILPLAAAHAHDVQIPVIVDTDSAYDDIRALCLLMNAGDVDIRLVVATDGVVDAESGAQNIRRLLSFFNRGSITVASGEETPATPPPPFRRINQKMIWPSSAGGKDIGASPDASPPEAIVRAVNHAGGKVLYICLGPMTHLAAALAMDPRISERIYRVLYLGDAPGSRAPGFNTDRDPESAAAVFRSGLSVYSFGMPDDRYLPFDEPTYQACCRAGSPAGRLICTLHGDPEVQNRIASGHMRIWDEMAVMGLVMPDLFTFAPDKPHPGHMRVEKFDGPGVKDVYLRLIGNPADFHLDRRSSVVLTEFPADPAMFRQDVSPHVEGIIRQHGTEEWKACLLTHELHRHLGIYSLVGAKMGIRARELLDAPFDSLEVVSRAGLRPPLSCMNDGLQVSTGASLGRGAIRVDESRPGPAAEFIYGDTRLVLTLKPSYADRIRSDIQAALDRFGGLGPSYFAHIRSLSILYWKEFDRMKMFDESTAK